MRKYSARAIAATLRAQIGINFAAIEKKESWENRCVKKSPAKLDIIILYNKKTRCADCA